MQKLLDAKRARGSPLLRKFVNLSIRQNLVMTSAYDQTLTVQTLEEGMGVRSQLVGGGVCYS